MLRCPYFQYILCTVYVRDFICICSQIDMKSATHDIMLKSKKIVFDARVE